jgi:pyrimidine-nucleoside phosphorylase
VTPESIIRSKRDGDELSRSAIEAFVQGFLSGSVADYQMSAFLMAVVLRGMTSGETADLTRVMLESGERLAFPGVPGLKVDKHSTGGVGDLVSLPLAPLVAACGVPVPMISGRGLGHTGGTLDKLESIPGLRTDLDATAFERVLARAGFAMGGQTPTLAPADRRMYALRDVTATVESVPLIVSSILSKKAAAGLDALVLDVKFGRGAFMKREEDALVLAHELVRVGRLLGLGTVAFVTDMDVPLGRAVGNGVEVESALACLSGRGPEDVMELVATLGTAMLCLGRPGAGWAESRVRLEQAVADGSGRDRFRTMVREQGGDAGVVEDPRRLPQAPASLPVVSPRDGWVTDLDPAALGRAVIELGGGRRRAGDAIDPAVGILLERRPGERATRGEALAVVRGHTLPEAERVARDLVAPAFTLGAEPPRPRALVRSLVTEHGARPWAGPRTWEECVGPAGAGANAGAKAGIP